MNLEKPIIKVLLVDDSTVTRNIIKKVLSEYPTIKVIGEAINGSLGVKAVKDLNPDVVILDIEMPVMNGLEAVVEIRKTHPLVPIIMFSTLSKRGSTTTLDALANGATDYATKPESDGGVENTVLKIKQDLVPKILSFGGIPYQFKTKSDVKNGIVPPHFTASLPTNLNKDIKIIAIGTSTGGPNALMELIPNIPAKFPVPIVIVQHMPPIFTKTMAERLSQLSKLPVAEASENQKILEPGTVWIAPGDFHLTVKKEGAVAKLCLNQNPHENSCRPSVDVLFESVAQAYGATALGVVLTGMGADGLRGSKLIKKNGGQVFIQDEESSVIWGMPGAVFQASLADLILPLDQMASTLVRHVMNNR